MNSGHGFPRTLRLLRAAEFQAIFDRPTFKVGDTNFLLLVRSNNLSYPRLGLVIAKKKVRRSVDRNRIKRQIRESFRLNKNQLPPVDLIVLAKQDMSGLPSQDLGVALSQAWKRLLTKYAASTVVTEARQ